MCKVQSEKVRSAPERFFVWRKNLSASSKIGNFNFLVFFAGAGWGAACECMDGSCQRVILLPYQVIDDCLLKVWFFSRWDIKKVTFRHGDGWGRLSPFNGVVWFVEMVW